jgi:hypothetical protein
MSLYHAEDIGLQLRYMLAEWRRRFHESIDEVSRAGLRRSILPDVELLSGLLRRRLPRTPHRRRPIDLHQLLQLCDSPRRAHDSPHRVYCAGDRHDLFIIRGERVGGRVSLPELRGEYLSGREAILPKDVCGRVALLLFGFTYQSQFAVEAWTKGFREEFGRNRRVTFYEIPMIDGMTRRGTPKSDRENVITDYDRASSASG